MIKAECRGQEDKLIQVVSCRLMNRSLDFRVKERVTGFLQITSCQLQITNRLWKNKEMLISTDRGKL